MAWNADGVTALMAKDTHSAVLNNTDVNPTDKTYGGQTYNGNAFVQQLNICVNTVNIDPSFDPWDPNSQPDPDSKYIKASLAALSFGKVVNTTGNDGKTVTVLSPDDIYGHVNQFSQAPPTTSMEELQNILAQGSGDAGADEAAENGWIVLDEEQRRMVKRWIHLGVREKANEKSNISKPLWKGGASATIKHTTMVLQLLLQPGASQPVVKEMSVNLPAFELDIDDRGWTGATAGIVRDRLGRLHFVKSLVAEQIISGIKTMAAVAATRVFNA
jgi:hypothetical protein